ncbi:Carbohydrate-binding, CenC-like domain protein [Candidatus Magnetoovum chiemensis]|nr:Carbohydrate-binding, CenC-like domain protein [Candidatus Magnetoovum chiemensis]
MSTGLRNKLNGINSNLVSNGSFSTNFTDWTQATGSATRDEGSGANSTTGFMKLIADGTNAGKAYNTAAITVKPHQIYKLKFYFKKAPSNDTNGKVLIGTTSGGYEITATKEYSDTDWTEHEFWFRTKSGTTSIYLTFLTATTTNTHECHFDEIRLCHYPGSLQEIFHKGFIKIYSGSQPSSADNSVSSSTLLCTIYSNGTSEGLTFDDSADGTMNKKTGETWSGTAVASSTAGWFRLVTSSDSGNSSIVEERIDGSVATSGAQLNMSSTSITEGAVQTISTFQITVPAD